MYSGAYDSARVDQEYVGMLSEKLFFVLGEVTGPNSEGKSDEDRE